MKKKPYFSSVTYIVHQSDRTKKVSHMIKIHHCLQINRQLLCTDKTLSKYIVPTGLSQTRQIFFFKKKVEILYWNHRWNLAWTHKRRKTCLDKADSLSFPTLEKKTFFVCRRHKKKGSNFEHTKCTNFRNFKLNSTHIIDSLVEYQREVFNKTQKGEKSSTDRKRRF